MLFKVVMTLFISAAQKRRVKLRHEQTCFLAFEIAKQLSCILLKNADFFCMRLLLSASRYFRVWAGGTGTGLSSRTAVLHWQSQRHHCGNHDWWLTQTRYIQRSKESSSSHCCRLLQQVNQNQCYYIYNKTVIWLRVHYLSSVMFNFNFNSDTLVEPYLGKNAVAS